MDLAIEANGLSKQFTHGVTALSSVTLQIPAGQIHGLVGRNGAGKTTFMKCLTNLTRPTGGGVQVFGRDVASGGARSVGALIEAPAFYPYLSGRRNLELLAGYFGVPRSECARLLALVGLAERASDKVARYSLGMKQRLGVAISLLGNPRLLILDEPVNGLDPQAIAQMRDLLRSLRAAGTTVLLSSHLLTEVEQLCDAVSILDAGRLVAQGSPAEIRSRFSGNAPIELLVSDSAVAARVLANLANQIQLTGPTSLTVSLGADANPAPLVKALVLADVEVRGVARKDSLESAYLAMTEEGA